MGATTWMPALVGVQALHGLTFELIHLVAMEIIEKSVPERLAATAQTVYGTLALDIASAALTFGSGYFYGWLGMRAFWAMAVLCAFALPLINGIGTPSSSQEMSPTQAYALGGVRDVQPLDRPASDAESRVGSRRRGAS